MEVTNIRPLKVAAVNFYSQFGDIKRNLARTEKWAKELASQDVEIVCFPELSITGYSDKDEINQLAQPVPGPITDKLIRIASKYSILLLVGIPERSKDNQIYISQAVVDPDGFVETYRKTHLFPPERDVFSEGDEIKVFQHRNFTYGIQICYESRNPKISPIQVSKGAEILFVPLASLGNETKAKKRKRMLGYLVDKAKDNFCYVVCCNLICDREKNAGVSLIIDPTGEIISEAVSREEGVAIALLKRRNNKEKFGFH